ncbi:MAG: ribosome hibernation-promoting factor, HPF/YfiA family [Mycoplasmatales bacterium]
MKVRIIGKNIEVTEAIKNAVEEQLQILDKYFVDKELQADVVVRTYKVGQKIEITVNMDKDHTLRQEEVQDDLYDAITLAVKKMERQVRKFKNRLVEFNNKKEIIGMFLEQDIVEDIPKITKRKQLDDNKLMTEAEAILQFELVGHDFFIFEDANTEITKVLYKRKDQEYGIIELT